jgi:outer membrane protein assembly factor BamB
LPEGQTLIYAGSGRGTKAVTLEKKEDKVSAKELWSNSNGVQFSSPVLTKGLVFGISDRNSLFCINAKDGKTAWTHPLGGGGGGGRRGPAGFGSLVVAGPVLMALTPPGRLVVFEPSAEKFKEVASYKVAGGEAYAYPVVAGNRVFIKDRESVTLWTIE